MSHTLIRKLHKSISLSVFTYRDKKMNNMIDFCHILIRKSHKSHKGNKNS
jgi:hypothetical protein